MAASSNRPALGDQLAAAFRKDDKFYLIYLDCGFLDLVDFTHGDLKKRAINIGICEQAAVSIAAGMAIEGLKPIVFGIASFLVFRAYEQIRLDLVHQWLPVKLVGVGSGDYFQHLGKSHVTGYDDRIALSVVGLVCFDYDSKDRYNGFKSWLEFNGPAYLR